jgi:O-antigen/teichoic acid export membrane protein
MGIRLGMIILRGIFTSAAVYLHWGLVGIAAASFSVSFISGIIYWLTIRKYIPWFGLVKPSMEGVKRFLSFSGWFFIWTLVSRILLYSDVLVLGIVATAERVTIYTLTGYAALLVTSFIGLAVSAIIPGLGGLIGERHFAKAQVIRGETMRTNWLLATAIGASILLWNRSFVNLWVGMENYAGFTENLLIVLTTVQLVFIRTDASIIDLTLDLRQKVILGGLSGLITIGLSVVLIKSWGILGLCLGLLIGRSLLSVAYPLLVGSALEMSPRLRILNLLRPGVVLISLFAISSYLGNQILAQGWIAFFVYAGVTFIIELGIAFVCGLTNKQKTAMIERFSQVRLLG